MQIICKDGTRIRCQDFEATDSGVLFYQEAPEEGTDDGDEDERRSADGFIPVTELRFVLPDEMARQQAMSQQTGYPQQAGSGQMPAGAQPQGGPAPQHQQMQQPPDVAPRRPPE